MAKQGADENAASGVFVAPSWKALRRREESNTVELWNRRFRENKGLRQDEKYPGWG